MQRWMKFLFLVFYPVGTCIYSFPQQISAIVNKLVNFKRCSFLCLAANNRHLWKISLWHGCQIGLFRPNLRNLASFENGWTKIFWLPFGLFWLHLKLAALTNLFDLSALLKENITFSFISATNLQNVCDKCYIRRPHSDVSNIWGMLASKLSFCVITGNMFTHCTLVVCCKHKAGSTLADRSGSLR